MFTSELWQQSGVSTYSIDQSIRFNDNDSPVLTASQTGAGDTRKKNTFSVWVKRGNLTSLMYIGAYRYDATNYQLYSFDSSDRLEFADISGGSVIGKLITNRVFRDPSAWYNLTFVWDTANAISSERMIIYVNGVRETSFNTATYPSVNTDSGGAGRASSTMRIGTYDATGAFFDGYLTNIVYVDNSALDASSFGETNDNGIWVPRDVSDLTFGTRGFYIDGRDSSALGDDEAGSNDFTTSGLSADDSQPDSPTDNHAVFNPLDVTHHGYTAFSEGNLAITYSGASARELARSSITIPANTDGFFETKMTATLGSGVDFAIGIEDGSALQDASNTTYTNAYVIREDGTFSTTGSSSTTSYGVSFTNNDVIGVWRKANGDLVFYKNGTAMNSGTPAVTGVTGEMHFVAGGFNGGAGIGRFASGQWTNKPSGVTDSMALNTSNLSEPAITNSKNHFWINLHEGNGGGQRTGNFVPFTDNATIANSCIFNRADSAIMSRTLETPTNGKKWTFSTWYKRGNLDSSNCKFLGFSANNGGGYIGISSDRFYVSDLTYSGSWTVTLTYHQNRTVEDTSKFYHFLVSVDTTLSTASDRVKIYIDGDRVTSFDSYTAHPAQDLITNWNGGSGTLYIGRRGLDTTNLLDGYMAETNFVDGTALGPDTFGVVDTSTNRWIPKTLSGITYGNSGWRLTYADSSNLGDDTSGNTNDFTVSNITSSDQTTDSPTQNHCIMDPNDETGSITMSEGNLKVTQGGAGDAIRGSLAPTSGKYYFEITATAVGADGNSIVGIQQKNVPIDSSTSLASVNAETFVYRDDGYLVNGGQYASGYTNWGATDVIGIAMDLDNHKLYFSVDGTYINSGNPANGTGSVFNLVQNTRYAPYIGFQGSSGFIFDVNTGQRAFNTSAPTGFSALQQDNLSETAKGLTDLVIIKNRDAADSWIWQDSLRGAGEYGSMGSATQFNTAITDGVQKFLKGGVQIEDNDAVNTSGESFVSYNWNINGGTKTTDASGDLSVELQANATAGISVGKFTVSGSGNKTWAHGLGGVPEMGILCAYNSTNSGTTYHHEFSTTPYSSGAFLTSNAAAFTSSNIWGPAKPTSTLWTGLVGSLFSAGEPYIFYSFRGIPGFSKIGSYTGDGNVNGPYVQLGFTPRMILIKQTGATSWYLFDSARNPINITNGANLVAHPNNSDAADWNNTYGPEFLSGGFKARAPGYGINYSGVNHIYIAFAENVFFDGTSPVTAR